MPKTLAGGGYRGVTAPSFRGETPCPDTKMPGVSLSKPLRADIVSFKANEETVAKEKKGLSKGAKWAIGIVATIGSLITAGVLIQKHEIKRLTKLFDKNLTISNLPENIQFKEAKTIDEAMKFAKETLGIGYVDDKFTLEMLNYANKGIVDVSNANKGRIFVPKKLVIHKLDDAVAYTNPCIESKEFGTLGINPDYFTHESLNKKLNALFVNPNTKISRINSTKDKIKEDEKVYIIRGLSKDIMELIAKFEEDPAKLSLNDKIRIEQSLRSATRVSLANASLIEKLPLEWLKNNLKLFKDNNIEIDLNKLKGLSKDAQAEEVNKLLETWAEKTGNKYLVYYGIDSSYLTLYHEMGHLQDFALNLEKFQKNDLGKLNFFTFMKTAFNGKNTLNSMADHWGGTGYKRERELMKKDPELFKELYPNLYKHINDAETHRIASQVGSYATTGIGEFIAETYVRMIAGEKLSDDVLTLYKKYNGPLPVGYK